MLATDILEDVCAWLGFSSDPEGPLHALSRTYPSPSDLALPGPEIARVWLERMAVPAEAAEEIVDSIPAIEGHPEGMWLLERLYRSLVDPTSAGLEPPWPSPWPSADPLTRYFHLYAFLAAVPDLLVMHAKRGVPEEVTWDTLGDLGRQVKRYAKDYGRPGFDGALWIWPHFRGEVYKLGRLQFEFTEITFDAARSFPVRGDPALGVHIPSVGPLSPEACGASLDRARDFFPRHFTDRRCAVATCHSWLMDEQLRQYLPASSNIVGFQSRFELVPDHTDRTEAVLRYVFGRVPASINDLPQRTSLEKAIVSHLRSGGTWRFGHGWLEL